MLLPHLRNVLLTNNRFFTRKVPSSQLQMKSLTKSLAIVGTSSLFLWYNSEICPITNQRRLNLFSEEDREKGAGLLLSTIGNPVMVHPQFWNEYQSKSNTEKLTDALLSSYLQGKQFPRQLHGFARLDRIVGRLLDSNAEMNLNVPVMHISREPLVNAYSLADHVVISESSLQLWTDDQLAFIVGHEMAHHLLDHHMENFSWLLVELFTSAIVILVSSRRLLVAAGLLLLKPFRILVANPIRRRGEFLADDIGLDLMMKAGYDPNQALRFWDNVNQISPDLPKVLQFLKDHPSHAERRSRMEQKIMGVFPS